MLWVGCEGTENAINVDDKLSYDIALNITIEIEDQLHPRRMTSLQTNEWLAKMNRGNQVNNQN